MNAELTSKECVPCQGQESALSEEERKKLLEQLQEGWEVVDGHHLEREYQFDDFRQALDFTNRLGEIAENQGHHPDIYLTYGKVGVKVWTHKIDGLTENDFIFAAKADEI